MVAQVPAKERPSGKISGAGDASQMPFVRKNVGPINDPATGWPCQIATLGRAVRHQCEYRGSCMAGAFRTCRILGEDRSDEHGVV